jgi:hypothetical protein
MKELANSFAQLAAIVMILITLAISTAAVAQWTTAAGPVVAHEGDALQVAVVSSE